MGKEKSIMTTTPLDESLDVHKRLTHLRAWQTEWYRIDQHLEEQVSRLDGNKLAELQQASHIANVRRRMEMTRVENASLDPPKRACEHGSAFHPRSVCTTVCEPDQRGTAPVAQLVYFPHDNRLATIG